MLFFASCSNKQKELDLKEKELELKERELDLQEKGFAEKKIKPKKKVNSNERRLRHLYTANGGLRGYFSDGTTVGCPRCDFCKSNIEAMFNAKPDGTYSNEEVFNEANRSDDDGWVLKDYKWTTKVPQF